MKWLKYPPLRAKSRSDYTLYNKTFCRFERSREVTAYCTTELFVASSEVEKRQHTAQQNLLSLREQPRSDNNIPFFCHASSSLGMTKLIVALSEVEKE
ncbi:MAG: hypothetical protein AB1600_09940 [Bacteroidota bacterium]